MIAPTLLGCGLVEDNFDYYVSDTGGSDSNPGTKAQPFATVDHAVGLLGEGESVGVQGEIFRLTPVTEEPEFHASLELAEEGQRLGVWGPQKVKGEYPILSGGRLVSGWSEVAVAGTGSNKLTNGNFETWASETDAGTWTEATSTNGKVKREETHVHSGTKALRLEIGPSEPNSVNLDQTISFESAEDLWISLWSYVEAESFPDTKVVSIELEIKSGTFNGYSLQDDLTWAPVFNRLVIPNHVSAYAQDFLTIKMPAGSGTVRFRIIRSSGGCTFRIDDVEIKTPVAGSGIFRASHTGQRPSMLTWDDGSEPVPLNEVAGPAGSLTANQWFYDEAAQQIYLNLGGEDPADGVIEGACSNIIDVTAPGIRISGFEFRHGLDRSIRVRKQGFTLTDFRFKYSSSIGNGGCVSLGSAGESERWGRVSRGDFDWVSNDGVWFGVFKNLHVDFLTGKRFDVVTNLSDSPSADLVQCSINSGGDVGEFWVHDLYLDKTGTLDHKGTTIFHGDGDPEIPKEGTGKVERVVGVLGNFGVQIGMNNMQVKDCIFFYISPEENWGAAAYLGELDGHREGMTVEDVILVGCSPKEGNGISFEDGGGTFVKDITLNDLLLVNCGVRFLNLHATELSGSIENIRMATLNGHPPSSSHIDMKHGPPVGQTLTIDNNIYPSNFTNGFKNKGVSYSTLSAFSAASGFDAHSKVEALNEAAVNAEIEAKLERLTGRILGTPLTYAEVKELEPA